MKNTGISWIGSIPDSWELKKVKNLFVLSKEKAGQKNPIVLSLARDSVKIRDISNNEGQLAENYDNYNPVKKGDLLLNPMDLYSGANCNVSENEGVISPAYFNLRAKEILNSKYFDYFFKTQYWAMAMFAHGKGVSFDNRWTLNADAILNYFIPVPPFSEQNRIVDLINKENAQIEKIIDLTNKEIETLKKLRKALIKKTITTWNVDEKELIDSGIKWVGKIPANSKLIRIKFISSFVNGYAFNSGTFLSSGENAIVRIGDIKDGKVCLDNCVFTNEKIDNSYMLYENDVVIAMSGATIGKMAICDKNLCAYINQRVGIIRSKFWKLIYYSLSTEEFLNYVNFMNQSSAQPNISSDQIRNYWVVLNDKMDEQLELLEEKCSAIDKIIICKTEKLIKLEEYRKSMVFEYVLGRKEGL